MKASLNGMGRALVSGVFGMGVLAAGSVAFAQPYGYGGYGDYRGYGGDYGRTEYRCTNGSDDHCAYFRCDRDGDDCHRVSRWTAHSRYDGRGWRGDRGDVVCDADGDDCRTVGRWNGGDSEYGWRSGW
jgi:hypothetical protein